MRKSKYFWYCNACGAQNSREDGECQFCVCGGLGCKRDSCSTPEHFHADHLAEGAFEGCTLCVCRVPVPRALGLDEQGRANAQVGAQDCGLVLPCGLHDRAIADEHHGMGVGCACGYCESYEG